VVLLAPFADSQRLWFARFDLLTSVAGHLAHHGRPIRYRYVGRDWPLRDYQSVFSAEPGSAEMPSAARPFTPEVVADLVRRGVTFAPLLLHTGVSSLEGREAPYPERYRVPAATARLVNAAHDAGNRVVAVGTTVVRALETVTDESATTHPGEGWTEVVVTPERGVRAVDGLVTGWHEPEATHLAMLEAVAGTRPLELAYAAAFEEGYLWHEFGDSHLLVPSRPLWPGRRDTAVR
jgi:S-adenosylmethionine:tRNA ribosyltransferase-isomerase